MELDMTASFWRKTQWLGDCLLWIGFLDKHGYGRYGPELAHRVAYRKTRGELNNTLVLDHLCRTPQCVNPDHLEQVTQAENMRRGKNATATKCPLGHEYSSKNTYISSRGSRTCRACNLLSVNKYNARRQS